MQLETKRNLTIGIREKPSSNLHWFMLSFQHVLGMFGATVLVPLLTGLDIGVALVASGLGTIIYIIITKGKVPIYLGSSFAYIAAIAYAASSRGFGSAFVGLMTVGIIYAIVATVIRFTGSGWIKRLLPPIVIGPVIMIIGLTLAPVAIDSAGLNGESGYQTPLVALITFAAAVLIGLKGNKFFRIVPFVCAIAIGYLAAYAFGLVSFTEIFSDVSFFSLPDFQFIGTYQIDFAMVLLFAPIAFVTIAEHIGDHTVLGEITQEDFLTDPGLNRTLLGDGVATFFSAAIGGPANTSYGENTGIVAMTKVGSVYVIFLAAVIAVILGFLGYIQALIAGIPGGVIGGVTILLYGLIASNGIRILAKSDIDFSKTRNAVILSAILVIGLGGAFLELNAVANLSGMSLAALTGIILNFLLPIEESDEEKSKA